MARETVWGAVIGFIGGLGFCIFEPEALDIVALADIFGAFAFVVNPANFILSVGVFSALGGLCGAGKAVFDARWSNITVGAMLISMDLE